MALVACSDIALGNLPASGEMNLCVSALATQLMISVNTHYLTGLKISSNSCQSSTTMPVDESSFRWFANADLVLWRASVSSVQRDTGCLFTIPSLDKDTGKFHQCSCLRTYDAANETDLAL